MGSKVRGCTNDDLAYDLVSWDALIGMKRNGEND